MRIALCGSFVAMAAIFVAGCAHKQPLPPPSVWPESNTPPSQPVAKPTTKQENKTAGMLAVSGEIWRICSIKAPEPRETTQFGFDSTDLGEAERRVLSQVAKCFTTGPLSGESMRLVGHADPRGEHEYNMSLGASRAGNVKGFLGSLGVELAKMHDTSRGELDANGEEEAGWAHDRRVDIDLEK